MKQPIEELEYDDLVDHLSQALGFHVDELKANFPDKQKLLEFVESTKQMRGMLTNPNEADIGWESKCKEGLDDEAQKVVIEAEKQEQKRLAKSIEKTGSGVTPTDLKQTREALQELFSDDDEDEED